MDGKEIKRKQSKINDFKMLSLRQFSLTRRSALSGFGILSEITLICLSDKRTIKIRRYNVNQVIPICFGANAPSSGNHSPDSNIILKDHVSGQHFRRYNVNKITNKKSQNIFINFKNLHCKLYV